MKSWHVDFNGELVSVYTASEVEAALKPLTWREERPTEIGQYWHQTEWPAWPNGSGMRKVNMIVEVIREGGSLYVVTKHGTYLMEHIKDGLWAGPIPFPH